ncbi:RNA-directed DNA polymerase from mobile element jockey [Willisornis vidua]|uniref:RNA-directed DNA polymerase from mobile element jockey n=1 Tax=Willisornis vidua TaxID=1566151 RepID=A0ABQ9CR25_9PASS|nr:RNA-directed DNA polymerase from mobile element jockey [Willisornis vidua]
MTMTARLINSQSTLKVCKDLLLQLDPYKSMGSEEIRLRILKDLTDANTKPLLMIFERSWESGEVPADWKLGNVVPHFKNCEDNPGNYRPISQTSVAGKVMRWIILGGIEKHLHENSHWSQPAWLHESKVLLIKPDFLLKPDFN